VHETKEVTARLPFVFIVDEINRGEISKIFGELFFAIDPGYRGRIGEISTQYTNLHDNPNDKLYIPENIYIIGTMNDIDRSVDTFDFAMRRRFTFEEITAVDSQVMLNSEDVKNTMTRVNDAIISEEIGLSNDYQIGGSYFLSLDKGQIEKSELWKNKLKPLLKDYFRGERNAVKKLGILESAYAGDVNDTSKG
jgi:5-methylcytosine-specific restriction endonuclease McrBC GTP-binding regulatory subunit McrB